LRDHFVSSVLRDIDGWTDKHLIERKAAFMDPGTLDLEGERLRAKSVIIATGSLPVVPGSWLAFNDWLLTSDSLFDLEELPGRMAVIGLGPLGTEMAQALCRLGVDVVAVDPSRNIGGLTDPSLFQPAADQLGREFTLCFEKAKLEYNGGKTLGITAGTQKFQVEKALVAVGRLPLIEALTLENLGVPLSKKGLPDIDPATLQVGQLPVFMAGDVNGLRPLQHEAANEGRIAGHNALQPSPRSFDRLTPLAITFCTPQIALTGRTHRDLMADKTAFVTGSADFEQQGRARIMGANAGQIRIYAARDNGQLLGAELFSPGAEHLAHLLAPLPKICQF
jgi:dihydrolipoamide dehydrogenase